MASVKTQIILETIVKGVNSATSKMKGLTKSMKKSADSSKKLAVGLVAIGAVAAAGLGLAVKEFANFEKEMSNVEAITKATGKEFDDLTELAKKMGRETVFTAKQSAEAMTFLGMAGFETGEIMAALPGVLDLAAASNMSIGRTADIASNILSGFQINAEETGRVVDVLAETITSFNVNLEEMGEAMKFMAPVSASMGISLEETAAAVGLLGNAGLKGGIATRRFASSLTKLSDPTAKMNKGMRAAGFNAFDAEGNFVGLTDTLKQLEEGMADFTQEQKLATISQIFGAGSQRQMMILLAAGSESLALYTKQLELSEGAARKMAETQLDNLAGSFTLMKSAISGLAIELVGGGSLSNGLRSIIDKVTEWTLLVTENLPKIREKFNEIKDFLIQSFGPAFSFVGGIIGGMIEKFRELDTNSALFKAGLIILSGVIAGVFVGALVSAALAFGALVISAAPFLIGGALIAGVVAGISWLMENWDLLMEKFIGAAVIIEEFKIIWELAFGAMLLSAQVVFGAIKLVIKTAIAVVAGTIAAGLLLITGNWGGAWEAIKGIFIEVWEEIGDFVMKIVDRILKIVDKLISGVQKIVSVLKGEVAKANDLDALSSDAADRIRAKRSSGASHSERAENREHGGEVTAGDPFIVGEKRPELFVPDRSGTIIPSVPEGGGGGITINISGVFGSDAADELGDMIASRLAGHVAI